MDEWGAMERDLEAVLAAGDRRGIGVKESRSFHSFKSRVPQHARGTGIP